MTIDSTFDFFSFGPMKQMQMRDNWTANQNSRVYLSDVYRIVKLTYVRLSWKRKKRRARANDTLRGASLRGIACRESNALGGPVQGSVDQHRPATRAPPHRLFTRPLI